MGTAAEMLNHCSSSSIFDALDELGLGGGVLEGFHFFGSRKRAVGPVETLVGEVRLERTFPVEDFSIGKHIRLSMPGSILLIDLRGESVSTWGALATHAAMLRGLAACVIRGGARDVEEIDAMDFILAVEHVTPRTGKGRIRFVQRDAPLQWGSVRIDPRAWIAMDRTGAVLIPAHKIDDVARRALEIEAADSDFTRMLEQGVDFDTASRQLGHF